MRTDALKEINRYETSDKNWSKNDKKIAVSTAQKLLLGNMYTWKSDATVIGIVAGFDPVRHRCPVYTTWTDGDSEDATLRELGLHFRYQASAVYSVELKKLNEKKLNLESGENCLKLLEKLLPGKWKLNYASKLVNRQLGNSDYNIRQISTDKNEIMTLIPYLKKDYFKNKIGIDPFAGLNCISETLGEKLQFEIQNNDINTMMSSATGSTHLDSLSIATCKQWTKEYKYCITSPPFEFLDIAIPLLASTFEFCLFHIPPHYIFDANDARHVWLAALSQEKRCIVLNITYARNEKYGRHCSWIAIAKSKSIMENALHLEKNRNVLSILMNVVEAI